MKIILEQDGERYCMGLHMAPALCFRFVRILFPKLRPSRIPRRIQVQIEKFRPGKIKGWRRAEREGVFSVLFRRRQFRLYNRASSVLSGSGIWSGDSFWFKIEKA